MRSLESAIEIRASPEAVFDLIHDYARRLEWDPFPKEACLLEGAEAAGLGVKTRCTARNGFASLAMETVYLSFDRPNVAAVKMTRGLAVLETFGASLARATQDHFKFLPHTFTTGRWFTGVVLLLFAGWVAADRCERAARH